MSIRVNPNITPDLLDSIQQSLQREQTAVQQLSTGRRVSNLSDDPAAAAALVGNNALASQNDQFLQNLNDLQGKFQVADSTLNSAVQVMNRAISLGVEGANGTLSASDRQAIAQEVNGLQQQMLSLSNTSYQGTYIFAGTDVTTQPFVQNLASPSGVTYNGNSNVTSVQISGGQSLKTNIPGDQLFTNPAGSVFQALNDLAAALNSGTGIAAANTEVEKAFAQINTQRVFYGSALQQIQLTENFLSQEKVNLSQQKNVLVGADLAQTITDLSLAKTGQEAVLNATGQILNLPTLLNYLK